MQRLSPVAIVTAVILASPALSQNPRDVQIQTQKVSDHVYMLIGQGGNIGLCVGDDGAFMIDDQFAPLTGKILAAVGEVTDHRIKFLINTHWHGDHTGGNENLAGEGAIIVAHDNVRARMSEEQFMSAFGNTVPPSPDAARPTITFSRTMTFHHNGDEIHVFHVPHAHTDGDAIIHFNDGNVFHMGDTFFNGMYPFIDVDSGGNIDGIIRAAELVLHRCNDETQIIPGHGPLAKAADLRAYRDMLAGVRDAVAKLLHEGKSREEVIAANPTAPWDEAWGGAFINGEQLAGFVCDSLANGHD